MFMPTELLLLTRIQHPIRTAPITITSTRSGKSIFLPRCILIFMKLRDLPLLILKCPQMMSITLFTMIRKLQFLFPYTLFPGHRLLSFQNTY